MKVMNQNNTSLVKRMNIRDAFGTPLFISTIQYPYILDRKNIRIFSIIQFSQCGFKAVIVFDKA